MNANTNAAPAGEFVLTPQNEPALEDMGVLPLPDALRKLSNTFRGIQLCHERAARNWRAAMRCHALMWKRQRGTHAGALARHSATICRAKAAEARSAAALEAAR